MKKEFIKVRQANGQEPSGPSLYEMTYMQQLREELEIFLRSRNFTTIEKVVIGLQGKDYKAYIQAH